MLTAPELDEARSDFVESMLTQKCTIVRASSGFKSAYGGREHRLQSVAEGIPCRVASPGRSQVAESGTRSISLGDWDVLLPVGTQVALEDELHVGSDVYEVIGSDTGRAEALCLTAYCRRKGA